MSSINISGSLIDTKSRIIISEEHKPNFHLALDNINTINKLLTAEQIHKNFLDLFVQRVSSGAVVELADDRVAQVDFYTGLAPDYCFLELEDGYFSGKNILYIYKRDLTWKTFGGAVTENEFNTSLLPSNDETEFCQEIEITGTPASFKVAMISELGCSLFLPGTEENVSVYVKSVTQTVQEEFRQLLIARLIEQEVWSG
jgi:hypothetical protein